MHNLIGLQENIRKKVSSKSMDSISGADLAHMKLLDKFDNGTFSFFHFCFCF